MKKIIIWSIFLLLVIALIPMFSGIKGLETPKIIQNNTKNKEKSLHSVTTADETIPEQKLTDEETEIIVCKVMEHITEEADTETKKAMLAICKNNYLYLKAQGVSEFETEISKYSDSFFEELKTLYSENEYILLYDNKQVAIPMVPQNGGFTATSDEYPYIESVASPWDTFSNNYIRGAIYPCGVSIYGIEYLCRQGLNWQEALMWYLPSFTIT